MALKRASIIKQTEGGQCVCSDNYTGNNCETAPAGESCGETMCSVSQHCENDTCVCNEGTFTCDPDTSSVNACCAEGTYCGSENEDDTEYKCLAEQACPEACSNSASWTTGKVSVQYCRDSGASCYEANPDSCASITVECGTEGTGRQYCYSTDNISWWDANSICKALGMRLPSMNELIENWNSGGKTRTQFAQNMNGIMGDYIVWSSNLCNTCWALAVYLDHDSSFCLDRRKSGFYNLKPLLCVQ